jgi:hypothetical protein
MANYYCDPPIVNTGCYRMIVGILHVLYSDLKQNPWGLAILLDAGGNIIEVQVLRE